MDTRLCPLPVCQDESKTQHREVRAAPSVHASVTSGTRRNILCHTVFLLPHWRSRILRKSLESQFSNNSLGLRAVARRLLAPLFTKLVYNHTVQETDP